MDEFDWVTFAATAVHPARVAIIEAMCWVREPLSANECVKLFGIKKFNLGVISYHMAELADAGWVQWVDERQARGARETYYYLPPK